MKLLICGIWFQSGKGRESGRDYILYRANALVPMVSGERGQTKRECLGMSLQEFQVADSFFPEFRGYFAANSESGKKVVEVDLSTTFDRGQLVITGFEKVEAKSPLSFGKTGT